MSNLQQEVRNFIALWKSGVQEFEAHTSGSTGAPKRIMLPRKLMEESAARSIRHFGLDSSSSLHLMLSPAYIAGKMCIVRALMAECNLTAEEPSSTPLTAQNSPRHITLLSAVGAQIVGMVNLKERGKLPHIKHLLLGGAPLSREMRIAAVTLADQVWESYGMTETASHIALRRVSVEQQPFTPLDNIHTSTDPRGCLVIDMPTAGHIVTNDLVELLPDGCFQVLGRADNVIISGSLKVVPEYVESKLGNYLSEPNFYISSRHHSKWGEEVILVLECQDIDKPITIEPKDYVTTDGHNLAEAARQLLKPQERPAALLLLPRLKRTYSGKLIREKF